MKEEKTVTDLAGTSAGWWIRPVKNVFPDRFGVLRGTAA